MTSAGRTTTASTRLVQTLLASTRRAGARGARASNLVAFSGGVDSSVVAALVFRAFPETAAAVLGVSPAVPRAQIELARAVAGRIGIPLREIPTREGANPLYVANAGDACFHCKTELYETLEALGSHAAAEHGRVRQSEDDGRDEIEGDDDLAIRKGRRDGEDSFQQQQQRVVLFNGTNADDMTDPTRVGLVAADNFSVESPLSGISKAQVREAARHLGLPNHAHAAAPCLRSRLAHGVLATKDHLRAVEEAERLVREHLSLCVADNLRVRLLAGGRSALEVDANLVADAQDAAEALAPVLRNAGFPKLIVRAFKSGSVNGLT